MTKSTARQPIPRPTIGLGLIVHPSDADLLPGFLARHAPWFHAVTIVLDADPADPAPEAVEAAARINGILSGRAHPARLLLRPLERDFAAQRNACAEANPCDWLCMLDADEQLGLRTLKLMPAVLAEVVRVHPHVRVLGMARSNVVDGRATKVWPDWQHRLVRRGVRWRNTDPYPGAVPGCHEVPCELHDAQDTVMVLGHITIEHRKSTLRQRGQQELYEACR